MASSPPPTAGNRRDSSSDNKNSSNVNHDGNGNADSNALKPTGAQLAARALKELGVTVIFGLVGIPVIEVAEEAINLGIRFIACRNEQTCGYAASAYGYMTHRPGVCLVVGGPGVLHAMAGVSIRKPSFVFFSPFPIPIPPFSLSPFVGRGDRKAKIVDDVSFFFLDLVS